jgi:predicted acetyltransferase
MIRSTPRNAGEGEFGGRAEVWVELVPAERDQEPVISNLLELYAHDFSEFMDLRLGQDGRFGYPGLALYWQDEGRFPFLITVDRELAGFALVARGSRVGGDPLTWDMAEFFVVRKFRRGGVGARAACEVWRRFPGSWEVRVLDVNGPALEFWPSAIRRFTGSIGIGRRFELTGQDWHLFSLRSLEQRVDR